MKYEARIKYEPKHYDGNIYWDWNVWIYDENGAFIHHMTASRTKSERNEAVDEARFVARKYIECLQQDNQETYVPVP